MRIGLDIDGVLYPWHYSIYRYFTEHKGYNKDIASFWLQDRHLITDYYVNLPLPYLDTEPSLDVLTYVPKLAELGTLYYITSRHPDLEWTTRKFFDKYDLPFKENLILSKDKATPIRLYKIEFFLDDLPHNVDSIKHVTDAYLFKAIHNRNNREGYKLINSIEEFYYLLKGKQNA